MTFRRHMSICADVTSQASLRYRNPNASRRATPCLARCPHPGRSRNFTCRRFLFQLPLTCDERRSVPHRGAMYSLSCCGPHPTPARPCTVPSPRFAAISFDFFNTLVYHRGCAWQGSTSRNLVQRVFFNAHERTITCTWCSTPNVANTPRTRCSCQSSALGKAANAMLHLLLGSTQPSSSPL